MDPITGINMKRMLARIDIRNNSATSNFTVEEVYLANYNIIFAFTDIRTITERISPVSP